MPADPSLSAWLDYYRAPLREALERGRADGFRSIVPNTTSEDFDPAGFGRTARRHFLNHLASIGLRLGAVAVEFPGAGLAEAADGDRRLAHLRSSLELARELGIRRASVRIGGFSDSRLAPLAAEALENTAELADRIGVSVSVQCGGESVEKLVEQVRRLGCPQLFLGLDSAAIAGGEQLSSTAVAMLDCLYLRDGRKIGAQFEETSFGGGEIDLTGLLATAEAADRPILLTVRRDSPGSIDALRQGREYILNLRGATATGGG